jgi:hypothetical protein
VKAPNHHADARVLGFPRTCPAAMPERAVARARRCAALAAVHAANALSPHGRLAARPMVVLAPSLAARREGQRPVALRQQITGHGVGVNFRYPPPPPHPALGMPICPRGVAQGNEIERRAAIRDRSEALEHASDIMRTNPILQAISPLQRYAGKGSSRQATLRTATLPICAAQFRLSTLCGFAA